MGPGERRAGHTCLPQILLSCRQEGKAYIEHGGEECSLILRAEANCFIGCSQGTSVSQRGGPRLLTPTCPDTSPPLARFLRIPLCPPALQSTSTHHSLSLKDKMEDACHSSDDLFSKVRVGTLQTIHLMGFCPKRLFCFAFLNYVFVIDTSTVSCSLKQDVCDICS